MGIIKKAEELAKIIERQEFVHIITHCDADGIAGGAIAKRALDERGIKNKITIVNYLDIHTIKKIENFTWFIDLGNAHAHEIEKKNAIISDHHFSSSKCSCSINPFYYGIDGETEISASGLTHLISSSLSNNDASLSIIGAIGDLQDVKHLKLVGMNRELLKNSRIEIKRDVRIYGRGKPLFRMLAYSTDPPIPGIFKKSRNAIGFLQSIGIDYRKTWNECSRNEKKRILSSIVKLMLERGFDYTRISRIFGEVYELDGHDLREYAAILNSMGKYGNGEEAIVMCMKEEFNGEKVMKEHRKRISMYMKYAKRKMIQYDGIYYFHGENFIVDTLLGTIAGMILREEEIGQPIIAFAENENGIKVSARAPQKLVEKGLNLSLIMNKTAKILGGNGGGHRAAAGALIPRGKEEEFLRIFGAEIKYQLTL